MKCVVCNEPIPTLSVIHLANGEFKAHLDCFYEDIPMDNRTDSKTLEDRAIELIKTGRYKDAE